MGLRRRRQHQTNRQITVMVETKQNKIQDEIRKGKMIISINTPKETDEKLMQQIVPVVVAVQKLHFASSNEAFLDLSEDIKQPIKLQAADGPWEEATPNKSAIVTVMVSRLWVYFSHVISTLLTANHNFGGGGKQTINKCKCKSVTKRVTYSTILQTSICSKFI